ncbi:NTP transferase domain-containing protein [Rhizorhabdus argentea]|uniref:NTP transferase domain-containing protein n=1 Tax=Rhizorhabdus argentea TaxID=1387174 RepID=UPI0030EEA346
MNDTGFTAIILAGQRPGIDPLAAHFGQPFKALIEVAGQPMLAWVGATLAARSDVNRIVILAQDSAAVLDDPRIQWLRDEPRVVPLECGDSIVEAITATLLAMPGAYPFLLTTADNVLLDEAIIDAFVAGARNADIAVALVERRTLLAAYPRNRRTWLRFRGGAYSGANLFWLGSPAALDALAVWRSVEQRRKKARAVLGAFGIGLALMIAVRLLTLEQAIARAGRRLGLISRAVILPYAEACIDVDKLSDHSMAETILHGREAFPSRPGSGMET